jgi:Mg2+/Co2+ transporter CorB
MTWLIIGIVACVILSAFFSSSEMSLSSSNRIRLENLEEEGDARAKTARELIDKFDDTLSTILVGNNLVNIAASSMASVLVIMLLGEEYAWVSTLVLTFIVIIFGETIPKIVSKKNATRFSLGVAGFVKVLSWIFKPVTWIVVKLVELIALTVIIRLSVYFKYYTHNI